MFLSEKGVEVVRRDVGGTQGRELVFFSDSGRAFVKKIGMRDNGCGKDQGVDCR